MIDYGYHKRVSLEINPAYANVLISCPAPGHENEPAQELGVFAKTEIGAKVLGPSLANVKILLQTGMDEEQALAIALGPAAVVSDEGKLVRAPKEDTVAQLETDDSLNPKKKVVNPEETGTSKTIEIEKTLDDSSKTNGQPETKETFVEQRQDVTNLTKDKTEQQAEVEGALLERQRIILEASKTVNPEQSIDNTSSPKVPSSHKAGATKITAGKSPKPPIDRVTSYQDSQPSRAKKIVNELAVPEVRKVKDHSPDVIYYSGGELPGLHDEALEAESLETYEPEIVQLQEAPLVDYTFGAFDIEDLLVPRVLFNEYGEMYVLPSAGEELSKPNELSGEFLPSAAGSEMSIIDLDKLDESATVALPDIASQLIENLDSVDPERAEEALAIVVEIAQVADKIYELRALGDEGAVRAEQELVDLCVQLLDSLDMENSQEAVMLFIENMILSELRIVEKEKSMNIHDSGTYEQKKASLHLLNSFAQRIRQKLIPVNTLGKYALAA